MIDREDSDEDAELENEIDRDYLVDDTSHTEEDSLKKDEDCHKEREEINEKEDREINEFDETPSRLTENRNRSVLLLLNS